MSQILDLPAKYSVPQLLWGTRKRSFPLEGDPSHFIVEESYLVKSSSYVKLPRNTPNDKWPEAVLVDEQITKEEGDGIWFDRVYSTVPALIVDYTSMSVIFPGIDGVRAPMPSRTVTARVERRYYLVGSSAYPTVESLPVAQQSVLQYDGREIGALISGNTITIEQITVTTGGDNPGVTVNEREIGGVITNAMSISGSSNAASLYLGWISTDAANVNSYSIIAESSQPSRYRGNIWMTETIKLKAR